MENPYLPSPDDVLSVSSIFPDIDRDCIVRDLKLSMNPQSTINRILDGTFSQAPDDSPPRSPSYDNKRAKMTFGMSDDDDDDDLPSVISTSASNNKQRPASSTASGSSHPSISATTTSSKRPQYTDTFSDDDDDIQMLKVESPKRSKTSSSKPSTSRLAAADHNLSESDDDLASYLPKPLSERINSLSNAKSHTISDSDSDADSKRSGVFPPKRPATSANSHKPQYCSSDGMVFISGETSAANLEAKITKNVTKMADKKQNALDKKRQKEEEKLKKKQEMEEKRRQKEYEKTKSRTLREAQKAAKPGEATKTVTVMIDPLVLQSTAATPLLEILQKQEVNYEIAGQVLPGVVTFWREVTELVEVAPLHLETHKKEVVEDNVLLVLPVSDFVQLVHSFKQKQQGVAIEGATLRDYVTKVKKSLENRKVTLIVQGIEKYYRDQRTSDQQRYREDVAGDKPKSRKKKGAACDSVIVSRLEVEEALVDLQMYSDCNIRFVNNDQELAKTVYQYTKAVAEAPYKRERCQTGFSLYVDGSGSISITKDGHGVQAAWRQQLQQFKNVTAEVANAIMADYPTPRDLYEAYEQCSNTKEGELLLQDIVIRRGVGVMATARRVGKELSRRLFYLMMSDDPDMVLR